MSFAYDGHLAILPPLPRFLKSVNGTQPPLGPRTMRVAVPTRLMTSPGVRRSAARESAAFERAPLFVWSRRYTESQRLLRIGLWLSHLPTLPARSRAQRHLLGAPLRTPSAQFAKPVKNPEEVTNALKEHAKQLGFSAVGIAQYDPKYTFHEFLSEPECGDRVVVCILEQNWAATQSAPSVRAERAALNTYARLAELALQLGNYLRREGYAARQADTGGRGIAIHYAVEAGLGQLGMNGQLLTPFAGSRCRLICIETDAPLQLDKPVDYGIHALCDACKTCVRRCPSGAIPSIRKMHRGVYKTKIKSDRCVPMVAQADGCAVCMKVCPVQRYGLAAVYEHYSRTGTVLGVGSDQLEGYDWPIDGRHYGPDEKPRSAISRQMLHPQGYEYGEDYVRRAAREKADPDSELMLDES